eukprot:CAMPEP_0194512470 /NCGR_PEP_ID=MMETSP0253-20130528/44475_1 /TAXON_ID=2966 /ORGANISM="Noctiluca scintillans" /LENGTH=176 /DNA_ID=CAMNT_0039355925 /DNA_START=84 /DNA_END=614 /DNA_ORIENTATION=-
MPMLVKEERHPVGVVTQLIHHWTVPQPPDILWQTLHTCGRDLCDFLGVEPRQALPNLDTVELLHELFACLGGAEVDEAVADVTLVLEIDGEIHEIESPLEIDAQLLDQHFPRVLVRNVPQHHGRAACNLLVFLFGAIHTAIGGCVVVTGFVPAPLAAAAPGAFDKSLFVLRWQSSE